MGITNILEYLRDKQIFSVKSIEGDVFRVQKECDEHYNALLTKDQMRQLIAELQELVDRPKEPRTVKLDYVSGAVLQSWHGFADQGEVVSPDDSSIFLRIPDSGNRSVYVGSRIDGQKATLRGFTYLEQRGMVLASSFAITTASCIGGKIAPEDWNVTQPYAVQKAWIRDETNRRAYTLEVSFGPEYKRNFFNLTETQY